MSTQRTPRARIAAPVHGTLFVLFVLLLAGLVITGCTLNTSEPERAPTVTPLVSPAETADAPLSIAWTQGGNLWSWRSRDPFPRRIASGGVIRPVLAPNGTWVAYLRGPGGDPRALWLSDTPGANERQLVDAAALVPGDSTRRIGQIVWSPDAQVIYFNTQTGSGMAARPADDLWRVDAASGTVENLLGDGQGGAIALSPDGKRIALAAAGVYAQPREPVAIPGRIALFVPSLYARQVLLEFDPVATASQWRWYPDLRWLPDGSALRTAIPAPELVYGEGETTLWELPVRDDPLPLGTVDADFFGLPTYSADGAWIAYMQRRATLDAQAITLAVARADGSDPVAYVEGTVGTLSNAAWTGSGARFTYTHGEAGDLWIGGPGGTPARLPADDIPVLAFAWADPETLVFVTPAEADSARVDLCVALLDIPHAPDTLATLDARPAALEAVLP